MKKVNLLLGVVLGGLLMLPTVVWSQACPNLNFSFGTLANWQCYAGTNDFNGVVPTYPIPGRHTIMDAAALQEKDEFFDEYCPLIKKVPDGFSYSCKLGNSSANAEAEGLEYEMRVDSMNSLLMLYFAFVLERDGHDETNRPRFGITIKDSLGRPFTSLPCGVLDLSAKSLPYSLACAGNVEALDWVNIGISLEPLIGQKIFIYFETWDCIDGNHFGYAYFVADCRPMRIDLSYCDGQNVARMRAPDGFELYEWTRSGLWKAYTQQINVEDPMDNEIFTVSFRNAIGCMFQLKTVIQKTKVNVSFMYGVLGSYDPFPGHGWENWYDTCTRTATFVDFSSVRNGKKDRITWTIDGLNAFSRDSLWTYQFPDVAVPTTYRVMLTVIAENGCADTASHLITIYPSAKVKIQPLCYGNSLYLKAVPLRHTFIEHNWTWKDADGIGHIQQGDSILVEGPFTYFLRSLSDEGCHSTDTFKVTSFDGNLKLYTIEGKITHHGNPLGNVNVYAGADYTLTNADGEYCIIADSNASLSLTPNLSGYRFLPASISCPNITNNLDNQHFTAEIPVTGINLSPRQLVMTEGGSYGNVKVSVTPNNADNKIVHTTNTNSAAAEILSSTVYAKSEGTTLLIFTTEDGGFSDTCEVIVKNKIPAMDIEIYPKNLTIVQGNSALLYVNFVPTNASDRSVSWQSLDNAVAAVNNNGTVTAAAVGTTSVVVTTADGNFSDTCQVIVQGVGISNYGLGIMNYLVYPNPTTGKFSVLSSQLSEMSSEIEVFDVVGRKLLSHTPLTSHSSPLIEIDISHLANGLYFLKIQTDSGTVTKKVVKQ